MADEAFIVDFVSKVGSYEEGVEALVKAHARLASEFDRTSLAGDRVEKQMLGLIGVERTAATATQQVARSMDSVSSASPRLRYALYDVASTATIAGAALLAMSVATAGVAIRFQREFADVARVTDLTGPALQRLREDFDELYRSIPISFADLTDIGTLAGQLDIADRSMVSFTETVAKFSATTGVTVKASATALGRLAQLLPDVGDDYEGLADSILMVGANSLSTEAQIIAISSQLAGVATTAGLTSKELVALAGTLASVGVAPELSRGTITRLFANIETAIVSGGKRLEDFATVSGRTSQEFRQDWADDSFSVIQDLFAGIGESGSDMGTVLRSLGITASRDIPVFQKLAQNAELLASAFDDASNAAGEVDRQYSIFSSTVAEKLTVLINNFTSLLDTLGQSTLGFGLLVDAGIGLLQILERIADNPVVSTLATLAIVAGVLGGAFLLFVGGATQAAASALAFRLAVQEMGLSASTSAFSLNTLTAAALGTGAGATKAAAGVRLLATSLRALSVIGIAALIGESAGGFFEWYEGVHGLRLETDELKKSLESLSPGDGLDGLFSTSSIFENSTRNAFAGLADEGIVGDLANFAADIQDAVGPLQEISTFGAADTGLARIRDNLVQIDAALAEAVASGNIEQARLGFEALMQTEAAQGATTEQVLSLLPSYAAALEGVGRSASVAGDGTRDLVAEMQDTIGLFTDVIDTSLNAQDAISSLGQSLGQNGTAFDEFSEAGRANMSALLATINAVAAQTPGDAATTAANMQALFDTLVNGAGVSASQLIFLQSIIATLAQQGGGIGTATVNFNGLFQGIATGGAKAAKGAGGAAKQVRTLLDYASDIGSVIDRAFDIRFGSQAALDQVTTSWMDLNEEIAEYQRKVAELTADRAIKSYFLSVAEAYGDALRAGVLRAEIADIDADLADATAGASKELTGNSKAATINRKRITDLIAGYGDYIESLAASGASQSTINAEIAKSRAEFIAQAQALGYSTAQLQPYIRSFDDMAIAVARVPKNITVTANTNPALQALNELEAAARKLSGQSFSGPQITNPTNSKEVRRMALEAAIAARSAWILQLIRDRNYAGANNAELSVTQLRQQLASGSYAEGGYTGNGGKYEPKGVVHGGEFVFTKQATSNAGVGNLYAMMRAMETGRGYAMGGYVPPTPIASSGGGIMGLSPQDRALLRSIDQGIRMIEPGYLPDEMVSRMSQRGDKVRQARGEIG